MTIYAPDTAILAPLSGYTDEPFRRACRQCGCRYAFTPLIDAGSVVYRNWKNQALLVRADDELWLGVQLLGSEPELIAKAARELNGREFDVMDFNMGCPVPKVLRRSAGAGLLGDPDHALRCVDSLVAASRFPVTTKIRILDACDPGPTVALARRLEGAGVQVLTIHGRIIDRLYSGPVATHVIDAVRCEIRIPVVANGGVFGWDDACELRRKSGCGLIMVARGVIGNPWIFRELATGGGASVPSHEELCNTLERHVSGMMTLYGEGRGLRNARKIILAYLKGRGYNRKRRDLVRQLETRAEFGDFMYGIRSEGPSDGFNGDGLRTSHPDDRAALG